MYIKIKSCHYKIYKMYKYITVIMLSNRVHWRRKDIAHMNIIRIKLNGPMAFPDLVLFVAVHYFEYSLRSDENISIVDFTCEECTLSVYHTSHITMFNS